MKKIILTGHSRGLGSAIAEQLLNAKTPVLGLSRKAHPTLKNQYPELLTEHCIDLSDKAQVINFLSNPVLNDFLKDASTAV